MEWRFSLKLAASAWRTLPIKFGQGRLTIKNKKALNKI